MFIAIYFLIGAFLVLVSSLVNKETRQSFAEENEFLIVIVLLFFMLLWLPLYMAKLLKIIAKR